MQMKLYTYTHFTPLYLSANVITFCRIEISSESRLKKLRDAEDETVVTGKKFTQKLKRQ